MKKINVRYDSLSEAIRLKKDKGNWSDKTFCKIWFMIENQIFVFKEFEDKPDFFMYSLNERLICKAIEGLTPRANLSSKEILYKSPFFEKIKLQICYMMHLDYLLTITGDALQEIKRNPNLNKNEEIKKLDISLEKWINKIKDRVINLAYDLYNSLRKHYKHICSRSPRTLPSFLQHCTYQLYADKLVHFFSHTVHNERWSERYHRAIARKLEISNLRLVKTSKSSESYNVCMRYINTPELVSKSARDSWDSGIFIKGLSLEQEQEFLDKLVECADQDYGPVGSHITLYYTGTSTLDWYTEKECDEFKYAKIRSKKGKILNQGDYLNASNALMQRWRSQNPGWQMT